MDEDLKKPTQPEPELIAGCTFEQWMGEYEFGRDPIQLSPMALVRIARAKKAREAKLGR